MMTFLTKAVLAIISGLLIALSFPGWNLYWFIWFAFCPLIWAISSADIFERLLLGFITGVTSTLGIFSWVFEVEAFQFLHGIFLVSYLSSFFSIWVLFWTKKIDQRLTILVPACIWVVVEFIRANLGFLALPWAQLSHSQDLNLPGLQIVAITGDYGLSFLIVLFNVALYQLLKTHRITLNIVLVFMLTLIIHFYGWTVLQSVEKNTLKVAVIQANFNHQLIKSNPLKSTRLEQLQQLSVRAVTEQVDLLVWPETALRNLASNDLLQSDLHNVVDFINKPLITGASEIGKFSSQSSVEKPTNYNSAFYVQPGIQNMQRYDKILLVPFAESIPLKNIISWPQWVVSTSFDTSAGTQVNNFELTDKTKFTVLICWENLFHDLLVDHINLSPKFFIHLSNFSWFGDTAASRQHNAISVVRAVEYGRSIIVANNSGPSQLISTKGVILKKLDKQNEPGILVGSIPLSNKVTFYSKFRNWFAYLCMVFIILLGLRKIFEPKFY